MQLYGRFRAIELNCCYIALKADAGQQQECITETISISGRGPAPDLMSGVVAVS